MTATPALGIVAGFGIPVPFARRMRCIRQAGFTHVALWWPDAPEVRAAREHLAPQAREAGLAIDHAHVPFRSASRLWSADRLARQEEVDRHIRWLADLARHAIPVMVMHTGAPADWRERWVHGVDSLERVAEAAARAGVTIALENTRQPASLHALLGDERLTRLHCCYDVAHDALYARTPLDLPRQHGARVSAVHWSDTDGRRDRHWIPGEGPLPHERVAGTLRDTVRPAVLTLEVTCRSGEDAATFLSRAFDAGRRLRAMMRTEAHRSTA
jgi:sugar phosphate isomerase/epimerase